VVELVDVVKTYPDAGVRALDGVSVGTITLIRLAGTISFNLIDNGRGGADPTGAGLDGLRRRIEASTARSP
jgi:hypothetical protein